MTPEKNFRTLETPFRIYKVEGTLLRAEEDDP